MEVEVAQVSLDEELRAPFACMLQARLDTNACLETTACEEQLELCYAMQPDCPMADVTLLTQLSRQCPGAIGAAR